MPRYLAFALCLGPLAAVVAKQTLPTPEEAWEARLYPSGCGDPVLALSLEHCRASRSVQGRLEGMGKVMRKLECEDGGGLQVFAFGGSISAGVNSWCLFEVPGKQNPYAALIEEWRQTCDAAWRENSKQNVCRAIIWTSWLERRLNEEFPCLTPHAVKGDLRPGMGSEHHIQVLDRCAKGASASTGAKEDLCAAIDGADLIITESATNDQNPKLMAELMARRLLLHKAAPALYWLVGRYSNTFHKRFSERTPPFIGAGTTPAQTAMLEYYNLAQVSLIDAFRGHVHEESLQNRRRFDFSCDKKHPSIGGHAILAELLLYNIRRDVGDVKEAPALGEVAGPTPRTSLPQPWFTEAGLADQMELMGADIVAETQHELVAAASGFELQEDVAGKPGLIATKVGAFAILRSPAEAPAHPGCSFRLGYLVSYEHMGVMEISVHAGKEDAEGCDDSAIAEEALFAITLDTLRPDDRVSILEQRTLHFAIPAGVLCPRLKVTLVDAAPAKRQENKIKLLTVGSACPRSPPRS